MAIYNFAAGPAMLPKEVMERAQAEFTNYQKCGSGIMELSHRGKLFKPVIDRAEANVRELLNISDEYAVLFIQGGASLQFAMLAMNLLNGGTADYVDTGVWSNKASKRSSTATSISSPPAAKPSMITSRRNPNGSAPPTQPICTSPATTLLPALSTTCCRNRPPACR